MERLEIKQEKGTLVIHIVTYSLIAIGLIISALYTQTYSFYPRIFGLILFIPLAAFFIWMIWILSQRLSDTKSIVVLTKDYIEINVDRPSRFQWNEITELRVEKRRLPKHVEIEILIIVSEFQRKEVNLFYLDKTAEDILNFYMDINTNGLQVS